MKLSIGDTVPFFRDGREIIGTVVELDRSDQKQPYRMEDNNGNDYWPFIDTIQFDGDADLLRIEAKLDKIMQHLGIADD